MTSTAMPSSTVAPAKPAAQIVKPGTRTTAPEREREVIALAYWSDLSQSEVARKLDIPLGTVKTRTRSALQHLAAILDAETTE